MVVDRDSRGGRVWFFLSRTPEPHLMYREDLIATGGVALWTEACSEGGDEVGSSETRPIGGSVEEMALGPRSGFREGSGPGRRVCFAIGVGDDRGT